MHTNDQRDVKDLKVVSYEEYDKSGKMRKNKYVQYTVIGNGDRTWTDFMPVNKFKKLNPTVEVSELV